MYKCISLYQKIFLDEKKFQMQIQDKYIHHSFHYAIKNNNDDVIAVYRIVMGLSRFDFPVGEFTELPAFQNAKFAEFSRLVIHPEYRKGGVSIRNTFANLAWQGKQLGITHLLENLL